MRLKQKGLVAALAVALGVVALVVWMRTNLDGWVKAAIEHHGSQIVGVAVRVESVELQPLQGRGVIRGLTVANPEGFTDPHAVKVAQLELVLDTATLTKAVVRIQKIAIQSPELYVQRKAGGTNFDVLQRNAKRHAAGADGEPQNASNGPRFIIDTFRVVRPTAQARADALGPVVVPVALGDVSLDAIGAQRGGVTATELTNEIVNAVVRNLVAGVRFDRLLRSGSQGVEQLGNAIKGWLGQ